MADQYGVRGGLVSPRVHLPVRSTRSAGPSPPAAAAPATAAAAAGVDATAVTLLQPRPDTQRVANEYVETPLRPSALVCDNVGLVDKHGVSRTSGNGASSAGNTPRHPHRVVVTRQPSLSTHQTFKKDKDTGAGAGGDRNAASACSIICRECGRCRCEACRRPRKMPSLWLCHNFCLCSAETCVDYGSCLCCVKGLMYHCASRDGDDDTCVDEPCSCAPDRRLSRWTCLGLTSVLLPCLCCYWPLKGLAATAEGCYGRCTSRGCRCDQQRTTRTSLTELTPEKRLLDSSPDI